VDGMMHACGHDVHTAVLMGTAATLASVRAQLEGTAVFLFQPSEEFFPGGAGPASVDEIGDGGMIPSGCIG